MEESWEKWRRMALESQIAARLLYDNGHLRPCASRYYYAAYQAVTALLLYSNLATPDTREAWSHDATPQLARDNLGSLIKSRDIRNDMGIRLADLYRLRVAADYIASEQIGVGNLEQARKNAGYIMKTANAILSEG